MEIAVIIPAVKKNVAFPDDLIKKLAGVPLIQRAIDTASRAFSPDQVYVVTDSEEINLICRRNRVACIYDCSMRLEQQAFLESLRPHLQQLLEKWENLLIFSPYVPLVGIEELHAAYRHFIERSADLMVPVTRTQTRLYYPWERPLSQVLRDGGEQELACESHAFTFLRSRLLGDNANGLVSPLAYPVNGHMKKIRSYEDWWICEKLLSRRRIVFRVIGHKEVGMGHIFRCLTLAHEITDHEIRFVCDRRSAVAAKKLAGYDYWLGVYSENEIEQAIIDLKPDLVVNDILDTDADYIRQLKENGIIAVNFEDLGSGAALADLTINDIYGNPQFPGDNILWGHSWFFVRDEFNDAKPHRFEQRVKRLLISFGGTDPSDLTRQILNAVVPFCAGKGIAIDVVTGDGYGHIEELQNILTAVPAPEITYTHATGVMSHIMERTEIAISSNGRTVYELAHMNIPTIVLAHHEREVTHGFACEENGFIQIGIYKGPETDQEIVAALQRLTEDNAYRRQLFERLQNANFSNNKHKVIRLILSLLDKEN